MGSMVREDEIKEIKEKIVKLERELAELREKLYKLQR